MDAALAEVSGRFTAYRCQPTAPFHGEWTDFQAVLQPPAYRDQLVLLIVDMERTDECVEWFHSYKSRLAETFQQVEIYQKLRGWVRSPQQVGDSAPNRVTLVYIAVTEIYWL